jgi:hypothetical protein
LEDQIEQHLQLELGKRQVSPKLKNKKVTVDVNDRKITAKWGKVEVSAPAPSQEAVDSAFKGVAKEIALVFAGALIPLIGVAVGSRNSGDGAGDSNGT